MLKIIVFIASSLFSIQGITQEQQTNERCNDPNSEIECGWHYGYIDPLGDLEVDKPQEIKIPPEEPESPPEEKEEKCTTASNWQESCGFVDPGENFDFQAKQRDVFLKNLLMKSNDPKSVENMQRYQKWLISKAVQASKMWEFNLVNKPELSAAIDSPVTSFGISMASELQDDTKQAVFEELRGEGAVYAWFTRSDCPFCHRQSYSMLALEKDFDINIRNVSLDDECIDGFEEDCLTAPFTLVPSQVLQIDIVPSFFVYLPKDNTWIRIANGVESRETISNRIKNFFLGVKSAHINGIKNGEGTIPSVDFSRDNDLRLKGVRRIKDD